MRKFYIENELINIINAAGADIEAIILGVGENLINKAKQ